MTDEDRGFVPIKDLFGKDRLLKRGKVLDERATLIAYFAKKMGWTGRGTAITVGHLKELRDLYYLKSDCDQAEARGVPWPAAFRTALGIRKKDRISTP